MNKNLNTLLQNLTNDDRTIRSQAAETLSRLKDKAAMPRLIELLEHPNPDIRIIAAHTIGEIERKIDIPETISNADLHRLISFLEDANPLVRSIAASALSKIDSEVTVSALFHRLKSETDTDVRLLMIQALVYIISTSKNEDIRRQAAESLEKIDPGNETAIQALDKLNERTLVPFDFRVNG